MLRSRERPVLENDRVRLRPIAVDDLEMTLAWRNQDHIRRWFVNSHMLSIDQHRKWFEKYIGRDNDVLLIIEDRAGGYLPVGQVSLYCIDWERGEAEFGRLLIGEACARGKGFARVATQLLVGFAFEGLEMRLVKLDVYIENEAAIAIYRRCGFTSVQECDGLLHMVCTRDAYRRVALAA